MESISVGEYERLKPQRLMPNEYRVGLTVTVYIHNPQEPRAYRYAGGLTSIELIESVWVVAIEGFLPPQTYYHKITGAGLIVAPADLIVAASRRIDGYLLLRVEWQNDLDDLLKASLQHPAMGHH